MLKGQSVSSDENNSGKAMREKDLKDMRFENCDFSRAFFGPERGGLKYDLSTLNVTFVNCRFDRANFKGIEKRSIVMRHFINCTDLQFAKHIPKSMIEIAKKSPGSISPEKIAEYNTAMVVHPLMRRPSQRRITDMFPGV